MSQQKLETPHDLIRFQLRTALTMERDSLAALGELATAAKSRDVKQLFRHHADETKQQIANLQQIFTLLGIKQSSAPSPSTKGISRQAGSLIERSAPGLRDQVTMAAALGNEHYEISCYEALILPVEAAGAADAVALLRENLDQETHTSEELQRRLRQLVLAG